MQKYTSKNTSVNHKKVPYIVNHIDWKQFKGGRCLDYGSGKLNPETFYIISGEGIQYLPYDPYWLKEETNSKAMCLYPTVVLLSNVLNVIKEDEEVKYIHDYIRGLRVPYFALAEKQNLIADKGMKRLLPIFILMKLSTKASSRNLSTKSILFKEDLYHDYQ